MIRSMDEKSLLNQTLRPWLIGLGFLGYFLGFQNFHLPNLQHICLQGLDGNPSKRGGEPNHPFTEKRGKTYKNATICDFDIYIVAPFIKHTSIPQTLCPSKKNTKPSCRVKRWRHLWDCRRNEGGTMKTHGFTLHPHPKAPKWNHFFPSTKLWIMIVAPANQIFDHTCQHFFGVSEKWSDKKRMESNEAEKNFECDLDLTISHCSTVDDMCHEPEKHGIHCKLQIRNIVPGKLWRSLEAMSSVLENIMHLHPPLKHTKTFTLIPDSLPKEKHDESWSLEKSRIHPQQIHYPNMYHPKSSPRSHQM